MKLECSMAEEALMELDQWHKDMPAILHGLLYCWLAMERGSDHHRN